MVEISTISGRYFTYMMTESTLKFSTTIYESHERAHISLAAITSNYLAVGNRDFLKKYAVLELEELHMVETSNSPFLHQSLLEQME